jgi:BolA protein
MRDLIFYHKSGGLGSMNDETYRARIERKLTQEFAPIALEINDDSHLHAGHSGQNPLGESHFSIRIVSPIFAKMNQVARHREIYRVLADELSERVHALSLQALSPGEYTRR